MGIFSTDPEFYGTFVTYATVSVTDKVLAVTPVTGLQAVENADLSYPSTSTIVATFTAQAAE